MSELSHHIDQETWALYFSDGLSAQERFAVQNRIMAHIAECPACNAFYEKAQAMRRAAQAYSEYLHTDEDAYQAVASYRIHEETQPSANWLSVDLEPYGTGWRFIEDSLETVGSADMLAMNPEDDGRTMADDGGDVRMSLSGQTLKVSFASNVLPARVKLLLEEEELVLPLRDGEAEGELPAGTELATLEITFSN